jgi:hypothetical protein
VRLKYQPLADDPAKLAEGFRKSGVLQSQLWQHAVQAAAEAPNDLTATFVESLNETIDTHSERTAAGRARIPEAVWLLLSVVAAVGCFTSGYSSGANGARTTLGGVLMPLLITAVIVLIFEITHPLEGLVGISQQPLLDLRQSMQP